MQFRVSADKLNLLFRGQSQCRSDDDAVFSIKEPFVMIRLQKLQNDVCFMCMCVSLAVIMVSWHPQFWSRGCQSVVWHPKILLTCCNTAAAVVAAVAAVICCLCDVIPYSCPIGIMASSGSQTTPPSPTARLTLWFIPASTPTSAEVCVHKRTQYDVARGGNWWLGGVTVRASDLRSSGRGFDSRSGRYQAN